MKFYLFQYGKENFAGRRWLLFGDKFLFMGRLFYKSITKSLDRGTMHFFLSQKEKSSKKEVGNLAG